MRLLPHIPYKALGLNFIWGIESEEGENLPKIWLTMNKNDLMSFFQQHEVEYGGIIYARKKPYLLKLVIEPEEGSAFVCNFNYHHEVEDISLEDLIKLINTFLTIYKYSSKIVNAFCSIGEKK